MPHCTVCNHPQHLEINQVLLSGDFTQVALSQIYGVSTSSLSRHKNHLEIKMSRARRRLQEIREQGSVFLLNENLESVRRGIAAAEADNDYTPSSGAPTSPAALSINSTAWRVPCSWTPCTASSHPPPGRLRPASCPPIPGS